MNPSDVWRSIGDRLRFYTKETASDIPSEPGIYAWFLPLWIYHDDLSSFINLVNSVYLYDAAEEGTPRATSQLMLNWDSLQITAEPSFHRQPTAAMSAKWAHALQHRPAFQTALMEASVLLPPLYVGKADVLAARYSQHVEGGDGNTFHKRFTEHARAKKLPVQVSDLLFACILTGREEDDVLRAFGLNDLLEKVMMHLARPPFSLR